MSATHTKPLELAHRRTGGTDVTLLWTKVGDLLTVEVYDTNADEYFELEVPRDRALDAFHHPYAYLAAEEARLSRDLPVAA